MQPIRVILALIIALAVGITVAFVTDRIDDAAVEKRIRDTVEAEIRQSLELFRESAPHATPEEGKTFIKKLIVTVMSGKAVVYEHRADVPEAKEGELFLFALKEPGYTLDFYIRKQYLDSELAVLDVVDYISGLTATVIVFAAIILFLEYRKRVRSLQRQFEQKHAEMNATIRQHEALALLGRMSAALAHELKTPIATISNLIQTFPSRQSDELFVKRFLGLTREELNRTQQLIDNLLAYGKDIDIRSSEWVPVDAIVKESADKGILVDLPSPFSLFGDKFYLDLLFQNLMRNSREAGADRVRVMLTLPATPEEAAVLRFEDNGRGFAPGADLAKLLEPFVTSRSRGGGLGLYLAGKIAAAHGGALTLERAERGARVIVSLPRSRVRTEVRGAR